MDYEQKYKEALGRAKDILSYKEVRQEDMEYLFPELKESEDEKIRKDIIKNLERYVKYVEDGYDAPSAKDFIVKEIEKQIAWFEKQGEQKPAWSEDDEKNIQGIINAIKEVRCQSLLSEIEIYDDYIEWLKSLKLKWKYDTMTTNRQSHLNR